MKKYLYLICLLTMWISGCSQEDVLKNQSTSAEGRVFTTSFESSGSRTYLEEGRLSHWTEGDLISLFDGNTLNRQYRFDGKTGDKSGTFSIVKKPFGTGAILSTNYAIYPYSSNMKISEEGIITTTMPSVQKYANNSFGSGANTMVAVTRDVHDTSLNFKNVGGCLKIQLYGDDITVKSINLRGNNREKLAGETDIIATHNEAPILFITNKKSGIENIILDCGKGVKIGNSAETATAFWIVVPPTIFEKGINITVKDINNNELIKTYSNELAIKRNTVKQVKALKVDFTPYITFTADATQTLQMTEEVRELEYSVGDMEWKTLGTNLVVFGGEIGTLRLRGKNTYGTERSTITFGNTIPVDCSGDIRTLIDYQNYNTVATKYAKFYNLFSGCTSLVSAPKLPITDLRQECYLFMFEGCTSLTKAPELPATTLAKRCYERMFEGCTSLTKAPELPATTLAESCYSGMFDGCTSLTKAPELPATTLAKWCYSTMFEGCTSLTKAPELPATTLAERCYSGMYWGCAKLQNIIMLATDISASDCLSSWVYSVSSTGTFTKSKYMSSLPTGNNGIPSGWTVISK